MKQGLFICTVACTKQAQRVAGQAVSKTAQSGEACHDMARSTY